MKNINDNNFDGAVKSCDKQRSSLANILKKELSVITK